MCISFALYPKPNLCRNGDFDLDTGLDVDNDLLDDFGRSIQAGFISWARQVIHSTYSMRRL
jgi:hypothetical protein